MRKSLLTCLVFITVVSNALLAQNNFEVNLRSIGNLILLDSGDSTSQVLPITEQNGVYTISFEKEISINPEKLSEIINYRLQANKNTQFYLVQVKSCSDLKTVYSYEVSDKMGLDSIPCKTRPLPKGCYKVEISFFGKTIPLNVTKSVSENAAIQSKSKNSSSTIYWILALVIFVAIVLLKVLRKKPKSSPQKNENIILGKFSFDPLNLLLIYQESKTTLTSKEADLLQMLIEHQNETVEKEVLLSNVWGNNGDYLGRTLDVFISKLRKKLSKDQNLKIINVRGVGYKLVVNQEEL